ncbi:type II toxin-antitoxin system ParD family antitoxin [Brucella intermedia]|uniref:ribbon-helix-helix domain-containing protein n=1 Tax=Brucella intermedia TaxID=94625 RepID=UPI0005BC52B8|nr:type II toxin-antitoxin system ParD family antitoxin [Brucella intermedia]
MRRSTQQFGISLPHELAEMVRAQVAAGEYATDSEVLREGLRRLAARDKVVNSWRRNEVVPAAVALDADPGRLLSYVQLRAQLAA